VKRISKHPALWVAPEEKLGVISSSYGGGTKMKRLLGYNAV
jgi:hypothetical protein